MTTTTQIINNSFVDIHSHILFDVDDGSSNIDQSIFYLKQAKKIGIKSIICTPHFKDVDINKIKKIKKNYLILKNEARKLDIDLYLGIEIMLTEETFTHFKNKKMKSLADSKYVLLEVKRNEKMDVEDLIYYIEEIKELGYIPILAHPELYKYYRNINKIKRIKESGILLQLDSTSLFKKTSSKNIYKFSISLIKNNLIDFVASDTHCIKERSYKSYKKGYKRIKRKFGIYYADQLFKINPNIIIKN